jgi:hypothetical protein
LDNVVFLWRQCLCSSRHSTAPTAEIDVYGLYQLYLTLFLIVMIVVHVLTNITYRVQVWASVSIVVMQYKPVQIFIIDEYDLDHSHQLDCHPHWKVRTAEVQ